MVRHKARIADLLPKCQRAAPFRAADAVNVCRENAFATSTSLFAKNERKLLAMVAMQVDSENKAIIVGGGYAGLAAAVALHKVVDNRRASADWPSLLAAYTKTASKEHP